MPPASEAFILLATLYAMLFRTWLLVTNSGHMCACTHTYTHTLGLSQNSARVDGHTNKT